MNKNLEDLQQERKRVLVVDDDLVTRRLLSRALERIGYDISTAANADEGEQIVSELGSRNFACAVVDYRMPGRNGIEFLTWLREQDETLSAIMLTAEGDKRLVAKILREGAVDYLDKPVEIVEFKNSVANADSTTSERRRLADTDSAAVAIGADQLQILGLENNRRSNGIQLCFRPMHQASGDFVGVFNTPKGGSRVIVGDVSGHDLRAAYFSAFSQGVLRGMVHKDASDQEIFEFFNQFLTKEWNKDVMVSSPTSISLCGVEIEPDTRSIKVVNSGFPTPCLVSKDGNVTNLGVGSSPLGWFDDDRFEIDIVQAPEGSFIYLWSDGLEDYAEHENISVFAMAHRLLNPIDRQDQQRNLKNAIDDILVMKLEVSPQGDGRKPEGFIPLLYKKFAGDEVTEIDKSQRWIESSLEYAIPDMGADKLYDMTLCVREALLNAMIHGCREESSQFCDLTATFNPNRGEVRVRVSDSGNGHKYTYLSDQSQSEGEPNPLDRHTGFILMRELPDKVTTECDGSVVTMDFVI